MNIVINAVLMHEKPRGVGRYINNLLPSLAQMDKKNQYYIYYGKWMKDYEFLSIQQENIHFIELDISNSQILRNLYLAVVLPIRCIKYHPDVFFLIDTQAIIVKPCKVVSTIHDLAEYVVPQKYSKKQGFIRRCIVRHQVRVSEEIMTVSNYSKKDICTRFKIPADRVHVVYNSVEQSKEVKKESPNNYFLFVSETEKAKNLMGLIKAYVTLDKSIRENFSIYVVGKHGNDHENILNVVRQEQIEDKVVFFGYVTDKELDDLYAKAYAFVFPSYFEGFGLPVLEAMAKGTPVLCSNSSSIPEVGGDAVLTFDPYNENEIADRILQLVNDKELRNQMIDKGLERAKKFDKQGAAEGTIEVFNKAVM